MLLLVSSLGVTHRIIKKLKYFLIISNIFSAFLGPDEHLQDFDY
jgi:hypothetical protein